MGESHVVIITSQGVMYQGELLTTDFEARFVSVRLYDKSARCTMVNTASIYTVNMFDTQEQCEQFAETLKQQTRQQMFALQQAAGKRGN